MKLLLDTHALLWMLGTVSRLSSSARAAIADGGNEKWISMVSLWEIVIKVSKGNLTLDRPLPDFLAHINRTRDLHQLPIQTPHLLQLAALPRHHGDPFDRLIVAQALSENCRLVSADSKLDAYGVARLW